MKMQFVTTFHDSLRPYLKESKVRKLKRITKGITHNKEPHDEVVKQQLNYICMVQWGAMVIV